MIQSADRFIQVVDIVALVVCILIGIVDTLTQLVSILNQLAGSPVQMAKVKLRSVFSKFFYTETKRNADTDS